MFGKLVRWGCGIVLALAFASFAIDAAVVRLYRAGKYSWAVPLAQQALAISQMAFGHEHPLIGSRVNNLAMLYKVQGRIAEAEPLFRLALTITEKARGPEHADFATTLNNLAGLYEDQGRYLEAEPLYERSLAILEKALGPEHPRFSMTLHNMGKLYQAHGRYREAESIFQRSLQILEKTLGPEHSDIAISLGGLAALYLEQGRYVEAEQLYKRGLALREKALGPEHPDVAISLGGLAALYLEQGRYAEAETHYKRNLAITEKALGPEHPDVAASLGGLATLYFEQGRYAEAEPLYKRNLAITEKALGPEHPRVAASLGGLAAVLQALGRTTEVERLYESSLASLTKALGPEHPDVAKLLNNSAARYMDQGRYLEAEPLYKRSLALREKALGPEHPDVATSLNNIGLLFWKQDRYSEAEPLYDRSLAILEMALGPEHPRVAASLHNLARLDLSRNELAAASDHWQRATTLMQRRAERGLGGKGEAQRSSEYFRGRVKATHRLATEERGTAKTRAAEMFESAQWAVVSEAAASLAQMAVRSAAGSSEVAKLVRERQDLVAEWGAKDKLLTAARSEVPTKRNTTGEKALADRLAAIDARLAHIDKRLAKDFSKYAALASPNPNSVGDVQAALQDGEVILLFFDTVEFKPLPEETFAWVVTKTDVRWYRSDLGTAALNREVAALRCGLDATAWWSLGSACPKLTGIDYSESDYAEGKSLPFDAARAHALYKSLLGDAADLIKGKHLLIVPSGALTTLPFQVLITKPPKSGDLESVRWLASDHAITVLPSVASLKALRRTGKPSVAPNPMIGFGNPLLDGDQSHPQHGAYFKKQAQIARAQTGCAKSPQIRSASLRVVARSLAPLPVSGRTADLSHLRMQAPLPETADELCEVARSVGGSVEDVRIGARATEAEVKRLSSSGELAKYKILHFATHGTLAGQLKGTSEPGLILTPPKTATDEDDGYLSGSEIASLKLDADWVILSACNTAGGAGQGEAAEALSGLARVFFYAGARALLVSHWEVDSAATVKLITTAMAELAKDKSIGRAEAMRRAMLAVMADTSRPANWVPAWHPSVWAPFVVVGEGGVGR